MQTQTDRKPRRFQEFRPPTGPYRKRPVVHRGWLVKRLAGAHPTLMRAAEYIEREVERHGARFAISSRRLGKALGMSQSTGSRCLRKLRDMGLLAMWRKHSVRYVRELCRWHGAPAVHEIPMTHPSRGRDPDLPVGVSHPPGPADT